MDFQTSTGKIIKSYTDKEITYSNILDHTHTLNNISFNNFSSMPDFSRITFMQSNQDDFAANPGTIYKINVPGYFFVGQRYQGYSDEVDMFIKLAQRPQYLFRHEDNDSKYGSYARPSYNTLRFKYCGWVNGYYYIQTPIPIYPGISTYMRWCDASSHNKGKEVCFVPCVGVPNNIMQFFTGVARGQGQIATQNQQGLAIADARDIFKGNWQDSFDSNNKLIKIDLKNGYYTFIGTLLCTKGHFNGAKFVIMDPMKRGKDKIYYYSGGTYILKYITQGQSNDIVNSTDKTWNNNKYKCDTFVKKKYGASATYEWLAKSIANKWCIVHRSWNSQTPYDKIVNLVHWSSTSNLDSPPEGEWQWGPACDHADKLKITYQAFK